MTEERRTRFFMVVISGNREVPIKTIPDTIRYIAGQRELSADGYEHWQLCVSYNHAVFVERVKADFETNDVQKSKDARRAYYYCLKKDTRIEGTEPFLYGEQPFYNRNFVRTRKELYSTLLNLDTREAALDFAIKEMPETFVLQNKSITSFINNKFAVPQESRYKLEDFSLPAVDFSTIKTHIFIGETGIGKTNFALAHFKAPLLVSDRNDLSEIKEGVTDGIVFDDMQFNQYNHSTIVHLVDTDFARTFNVKYSTARIPVGMPRIFTFNKESDFWPASAEDENRAAIARRIKIHHFSQKLYK